MNFASGARGWFSPDELISKSVKIALPDGHKVDRVLSGKFKERRWHLCLVAQPKLWPDALYRVHANVAVTTDGRTPLPGEQLQRIRLRLRPAGGRGRDRPDHAVRGVRLRLRSDPNVEEAAV